ncbi:MAG: hypothetical protein AAGE52_15000 [Myxococcota bacterium]
MRAVLAMIAFGVLACGASPRMVHQSSKYFERCHAAELNPERTNEERRGCWSAWLEHYGERSTSRKRAYATNRIAELSGGSEIEPLPDIVATEAEVTPGDPIPRSSPQPPLEPPPSACAEVCDPELAACVGRCNRQDCLTACRAEFRICENACS